MFAEVRTSERLTGGRSASGGGQSTGGRGQSAGYCLIVKKIKIVKQMFAEVRMSKRLTSGQSVDGPWTIRRLMFNCKEVKR